MAHDELAKRIAAKSAQLKRRMARARQSMALAEQSHDDLCALLAEAAGAACAAGAISAATESEVIAPKDEDGEGGGG